MDISYSWLKRLAIVAVFLLILLILLIINYGHIFWRASQYEVMKKRNREIEQKFSELQQLKRELSSIKQTENKLRNILGVSKQPVMLTINDINRGAVLNASSVGSATPDSNYAQESGILPERTTPSLMPVKGWVSAVMSTNHSGVDIAAREGDPVVAAADGIVSFAGWDNYFGNQVIISHGQKFTTMYGHNAKLFVKEKQTVKQGQVIALVGSTGQSTGPHLHFEVKLNGKTVDPSFYWINH
jgi:murein DD-endopeptidase MepM/ murein hydrolase activator NlpD